MLKIEVLWQRNSSLTLTSQILSPSLKSVETFPLDQMSELSLRLSLNTQMSFINEYSVLYEIM